MIQDLIQEGSLLPITVFQEGMARGELRETHPVQAWWSLLGMCIFSFLRRDVVKHVSSSTMLLPPPEWRQGRQQIKDILSNGLVPSTAPR